MTTTAVPLKLDVIEAQLPFTHATKSIGDFDTEEMVIALCGPIGTPLHQVASELERLLKGDYDYECQNYLLSSYIKNEKDEFIKGPDSIDKMNAKITEGNRMRRKFGGSVLAELAIHSISIYRDKNGRKEVKGGPAPQFESLRVCHIIDSIKNTEELNLLRKVYGNAFYCIGVHSPIKSRIECLSERNLKLPEIQQLIDLESGEELESGQKVDESFPKSDFFLKIESHFNAQSVQAKLSRFLSIILRTGIVSPTPDENAMFLAASSACNSACLSRQVGACITDGDGNPISVGWNDVPKFGGNLYFSEKPESDHRCLNWKNGICHNDSNKDKLSEGLVEALIKNSLIDPGKKIEILRHVKKAVKNLIEFSRSVHAEMHALLGALEKGVSVTGGKLFCTTYPCHSCARHMVAAGIYSAYYIEPYKKSKAVELHSDSISENPADGQKMILDAFEGISPSRFKQVFEMKGPRKENGHVIRFDRRSGKPEPKTSLQAFPVLESVIVRNLVENKLVPTQT